MQTSPVFDSNHDRNKKDVTSSAPGPLTATNLDNIVSNLEKSINNNQQRSDQFDYNSLTAHQQDKSLSDKESFDLGSNVVKADKQLTPEQKSKFIGSLKPEPLQGVGGELMAGGTPQQQQPTSLQDQEREVIEKQKVSFVYILLN